MNKRQAKKLVQYEISDVIDFLAIKNLNSGGNKQDDGYEKNVFALLNLYDTLIEKINEAKLLPDSKAKKAHFHNIFEQLDTTIEAILKTKK